MEAAFEISAVTYLHCCSSLFGRGIMLYRRGILPLSGHPPCEQSEPVANAAQFEQSEPMANELNEPVAEQRAAKARSKNKGGGKRKEWKEIGIETVEAKESLREAARRWLAEKKIIHRPLNTSSNNRH